MPRTFPYSRRSYSEYFPPGVKWLLIVNTAIWVLTYLSPSLREELTVLFALTPRLVIYNWTVWQLFTYMFLHGGLTHILFNMFALWMFGTPLEQQWGTRKFLKYYIYCGIAAGVCDVGLNAALHHWNTSTIGASGAIFGLLLAFGVLYPDQTVLMGFLFPIKAKYMVMIYGAIELILSIGPNTGISSFAHLGGMAFGYIYLKGRLPRFHLPDGRGAYRQWKLQRAKRKFQVYMRKHGGRGPFVN